MTALTARSIVSEIMDDQTVGYEEFAETLRQLELINRLIGSYRPTLIALEKFWRDKHHNARTPLRILDIGCGFGDTLRRIHHWAKSHGRAVELTGIDLSPWSTRAATAHTPAAMNIRYLNSDIFKFKEAGDYHVIINSLFTHHLSDDGIVRVLKWMTANARYGWFINDLHRHPVPYHFIAGFTRLLRFNRLIRNDAPLSVARSFTRADWVDYVNRAELDMSRVAVNWYWAFRYGVRYEV